MIILISKSSAGHRPEQISKYTQKNPHDHKETNQRQGWGALQLISGIYNQFS